MAVKVDLRVRTGAGDSSAAGERRTCAFDLIFIDADKRGNPDYLAGRKSFRGREVLIVVDNVVRHGALIDPSRDDADIQGIRRFFDLLAEDPHLSATAIQTVGSKGWTESRWSWSSVSRKQFSLSNSALAPYLALILIGFLPSEIWRFLERVHRAAH